jgi:hypothetical protein
MKSEKKGQKDSMTPLSFLSLHQQWRALLHELINDLNLSPFHSRAGERGRVTISFATFSRLSFSPLSSSLMVSGRVDQAAQSGREVFGLQESHLVHHSEASWLGDRVSFAPQGCHEHWGRV